MKVAINAICAENQSGTGRYATELLAALAEVDRTNTYVVCARRSSPLVSRLKEHPNFEVDAVAPDDLPRRHLFERLELLAWIDSHHVDLFHGPAFVVPARCRVPSVVTIHDLVFKLFPRTVPISRRYYYRTAIPRSIQAASRILADSRCTARDLAERMGAEPARISVVPLGVGLRFFAEPETQQAYWARTRLHLPDRYWITVGTLEPRKNLSRLLKAYSLLSARRSAPPLVIVGRKGWGVSGLERQVSRLGLRDRVRFVGFVSDGELPILYRLASGFVCVSLYEGFGLPVLEAMAAGVPVVASDSSSIPEVTGNVATLVNPLDPEAIAQGIEQVLNAPEEETRARIEAGRERARTFSWRSTAERTLAVYESLYSLGL
ncbi:glycosyltransferase family 4 protein [Candidatus Sumerlaeota bacterium]|nr:glycosyltransferase family 4 protein [Candidatus Sumerlaeota bacterium]